MYGDYYCGCCPKFQEAETALDAARCSRLDKVVDANDQACDYRRLELNLCALEGQLKGKEIIIKSLQRQRDDLWNLRDMLTEKLQESKAEIQRLKAIEVAARKYTGEVTDCFSWNKQLENDAFNELMDALDKCGYTAKEVEPSV